ncbi:nitronate monooxygenase [Pandoraea terrae]|uniref:nitronate monooxygenase n=1 Tax=Pandoraea terrae TaxID=1537710 RepID=UPI001CD4F2B5|nr:nitronate monooxygenase [Pandoraea terrae]
MNGPALIPANPPALKVPVVASGGNADGQGLRPALMLSAQGFNMGTRCCAMREAQIHDGISRALRYVRVRGTRPIFLNNATMYPIGRP